MVAVAQGDLETPRAVLDAWHAAGHELPVDLMRSGRLWGLAVCAHAVGDQDAARHLYDHLTPYDGQLLLYAFQFIAASAAFTLGLLAETLDQRDRALAHYTDALALEEGCGAETLAVRTRDGPRAGPGLGRQRARHERHLAGERLARRRGDLAPARSRPAREAGEVHDLVVPRAAAQARRVGARRALDEHVERPPDEALRALAGAALDDLDEPLHALDLHLVRDEPSVQLAASVPRRGEKMNVKAPS